MINRHQELRRMALQIYCNNGGSEANAIRDAKLLQAELDSICEFNGHDYRTPKSGTELFMLGDDAMKCFGCGKEKSDE